MELNVWKIGRWTWRYYIAHPIKWLHDIRLSFKWMWQRATRGYADVDRFNLCDWLLAVLAPMFEEFAAKHVGYPCGANELTDEAWTALLKEVAWHLRNGEECQKTQVNEFEEAWEAQVERRAHRVDSFEDKNIPSRVKWADPTDEDLEVIRKYNERELEILHWREEQVKIALHIIGSNFFSLWD